MYSDASTTFTKIFLRQNYRCLCVTFVCDDVTVTRMSKKMVEVESEKSHYETQFDYVKHKLQQSEQQATTHTIDNLQDQVTAISDLKRYVRSS